ncbi:hypothetical protein [Flavobacterium sangjuense]|uniref:Uncharacterized protein n=1 Tax=Flavobacterium sangjuense TaxID=2518177 RepID=A0A4P7PQ16_9FLAO|nr:hypothetical protein [Flavobacterium sangjuense]QBZ96858.1 hypothetical protein GS03_00341 [Flavobacterium sangjuense]
MKKLLNILLFGNTFFKEYPAVSIDENEIKERVFFEVDGKQIDVSQRHWLLSLEPMVFGIWFENVPNFDKKTKGKLYFKSGQNKTLAIVELNLTESITEKEGILLLFTVEESNLFYISPFKTKLIYELYYKKPNLSYILFKNLAAAFSYPRKVRLVSFKKDDYFNIFPMDLAGNIPNTNYFVFGLRHTNNTLDKIIEEKKIVVAEFPSTLKEEIYQLAKHHSGNPPSVDALPFSILETNSYQFPIPESVIQYDEIEILKTLNLGSHMLLFGKTINTIVVNENAANLYHIHFLNHLNQNQYEPT